MTSGRFIRIFEKRVKKSRETLGRKAVEYMRGDRLSNFKQAGAAMACSPEKALLGMMTKHTISIIDMVNDIDSDEFVAAYKDWDEKIGDAINYLILLDALLQERLNID